MKTTVIFVLLVLAIFLIGCTQSTSNPPANSGPDNPELSDRALSNEELDEFGSALDEAQTDIDQLGDTEDAPDEFPE